MGLGTLLCAVPFGSRSRLNLAYRVVKQTGVLILEGETFHACANVNNKPKRLPESLREHLLPFLRPPA